MHGFLHLLGSCSTTTKRTYPQTKQTLLIAVTSAAEILPFLLVLKKTHLHYFALASMVYGAHCCCRGFLLELKKPHLLSKSVSDDPPLPIVELDVLKGILKKY